jgi:hypothetical protein
VTEPLDPRPPASLAPEHDWATAARLIHPVLRPAGTTGIDGRDVRPGAGGSLPSKPLIAEGPGGLAVAYLIPAPGFGVFAGADHLLSWAVGPDQIHATALANLAVWSAGTPWESETSGARTMVWSGSGDGLDAARILLPEVREELGARLGGRVLIGLPERDLLLAVAADESDAELADLFAAYVSERWAEADDRIDGRVFELVGGVLTALPPAR